LIFVNRTDPDLAVMDLESMGLSFESSFAKSAMSQSMTYSL
jgi:hypothetical protein